MGHRLSRQLAVVECVALDLAEVTSATGKAAEAFRRLSAYLELNALDAAERRHQHRDLS